MKDEAVIYSYFKDLGFADEIARIYLALHRYSPQTISEVARTANVQRIQVYRLLDTMQQANLIETEMQYKRSLLHAAPIDNLRLLIVRRENQLMALKNKLPIVEGLLYKKSVSSPATRVHLYSGPQGIRQMLWSQLKAKTEIVCYNYLAFEDSVGKAFIEKWAAEFEERKLTCRLIYGESFRSTLEIEKRIQGMAYNRLSSDTLNLTYSCDIYDDVTAYYHWQDNEIFGLEIHNKQIAQSQRQIFEMLWDQSVPDMPF